MYTNQKKIRVGILMGGRSIEKEASFNSGRTAYDYLDRLRFIPIPLYLVENNLFILPERFLYRGKTSDFVDTLSSHATKISWEQLITIVDIVLVVLHGRWGEDGTLQGLLTLLKVPFVGTGVAGCAFAMDKFLQKQLLASANIETPRGFLATTDQWSVWSEIDYYNLLAKYNVTFPLIIKPRAEGSSLGVTYVNSLERLVIASKQSGSIALPDYVQDVLIEEKIEGMEFTVILLTRHATNEWYALEPTEIIVEAGTAIFEYEQKYMPGRGHKITPARIESELKERIKQTCIKAAQAVGASMYCRVDGFLKTDNSVVILDINRTPGMSPSSLLFMQAAHQGMTQSDVLSHIVTTPIVKAEDFYR